MPTSGDADPSRATSRQRRPAGRTPLKSQTEQTVGKAHRERPTDHLAPSLPVRSYQPRPSSSGLGVGARRSLRVACSPCGWSMGPLPPLPQVAGRAACGSNPEPADQLPRCRRHHPRPAPPYPLVGLRAAVGRSYGHGRLKLASAPQTPGTTYMGQTQRKLEFPGGDRDVTQVPTAACTRTHGPPRSRSRVRSQGGRTYDSEGSRCRSTSRQSPLRATLLRTLDRAARALGGTRQPLACGDWSTREP
jgi:hypothetical protein